MHFDHEKKWPKLLKCRQQNSFDQRIKAWSKRKKPFEMENWNYKAEWKVHSLKNFDLTKNEEIFYDSQQSFPCKIEKLWRGTIYNINEKQCNVMRFYWTFSIRAIGISKEALRFNRVVFREWIDLCQRKLFDEAFAWLNRISIKILIEWDG